MLCSFLYLRGAMLNVPVVKYDVLANPAIRVVGWVEIYVGVPGTGRPSAPMRRGITEEGGVGLSEASVRYLYLD